MAIGAVLCGVFLSFGIMTMFEWRVATRSSFDQVIARHAGIVIPDSQVKSSVTSFLKQALASSPQAPWGNDRKLKVLLRQSGRSQSLSDFRSNQLSAALSGVAIALCWCTLRSVTHHGSSLMLGLVLMISAIPTSGWLLRVSLDNDVATRAQKANSELPNVLELLAFSIAAGEPVVAGIERITRLSAGVISQELSRSLVSISAGLPLADALRALKDTFDSPQLARSLSAITTSLERGTPLANVLRAQASDARAEHARELIVLAGKKESAMLLPVVFLILPMIVLVAIYPGLIALKVL